MSTVRCPTCGKPFDSEHTLAMPFCSARCRQIDLGRWLDETNRLPVDPLADDDEPDPARDAPVDDE